MASKPIGTIFVELDLDSSRYLKGQQQLLKDATSTSLSIEQNFKNLGIKSAAEMDLMRAKIKNSFDMIANSSKATANDIIRAEEAKNAKLQALNEKQFGSHIGLIDKLKANWIAASVAVTAAIVAIRQAMTYVEQGAKALQQESSFKIVAEHSGIAADELIENMKRATKETVDDSDLMAKATKLMLKGFNADQIERFADVAGTAAVYMGTTVSEAFDQVGDAIANKMPRAMVRAGAVTRDQMKLVQAAIAAGADDMALYELAMANLGLMKLQLQGKTDGATLALQRFHAQVKEAGESIGKFLIRTLQVAWGGLQDFAAGALYAYAALRRFLVGVAEMTGSPADLIAKEMAAIEAVEKKADDLKAKGKANITGVAEMENKATADSIAAAQAKVNAQIAAMKAIVDAEKGRKDMLKNLQHEYKALYDLEVQAAEHTAKMAQDAGTNELDVQEQLYASKQTALNKWYDSEESALLKWSKTSAVAQAGVAALYQDYAKKWEENENKKVEAVAGYAKRNVEVEASMYKAINQYSTDSVNAEIKALEQRAREEGRWTADSYLKYAALQEGKMQIEDRTISKALSGFALLNEYSEQSYALRRAQYEREAKGIEDATKGEIKASDIVTKKIEDDRQKQTQAAAAYYTTIPGYSSSALALYMQNLEIERKKVADTTKDEAASYEWLRNRQRDVYIAMGKISESYVDQMGAAFKQFEKESENSAGAMYDVTKKACDGMADALTEFVMTGKMDFKSLADSIIRDLIRIMVQKAMVGMFGGGGSLLSMGMSMFGGGGGGMDSTWGAGGDWTFRNGSAFSRGNVIPFASGGVVERPTIFPMAKGAGLMGEAGPEAIMPLKRLPGGRLGVESAQTTSNLTISVPVTVAQKSNRMASELRTEIEETVHKVIRRHS